jgi:hypothetical protein
MTDLRTAAQQALEALEICAVRQEHQWHGLQQVQIAKGSLRAALEQPEPEQEPVATVAMDVSRAHLSWNGQYLGQRPDMKIAMLLKDLPVGTLLYTHQPRREWRGLTLEEVQDSYNADYQAQTRAIEAALKEKNT